MRKVILASVFSTIMCCVSFGATLQRTILSHQGTLTQYDANHWQDAFTDAVAGDTIYFTPGLFTGNITINKPITIIGAGVSETDAFWKETDVANVYEGCATTGESTNIFGNIDIAIPGNVFLTATLLEGINLYTEPGYGRSNLYITQSVTGLTIKRCQFPGTEYSWGGGEFNPQATVTNLTLEDCYIANLQCGNLVNPDIHNCYIDRLHNVPEEMEFLNNVILGIGSETKNCTFVNCIVHGGYDALHNTFINCLHRDTDINSTYTTCWQLYDPQFLTTAQLSANGYLGTDNTVVGPLGGPAPFTLIPSQPYVSSSTLTYNKSTKKLNVNVTVKQGK